MSSVGVSELLVSPAAACPLPSGCPPQECGGAALVEAVFKKRKKQNSAQWHESGGAETCAAPIQLSAGAALGPCAVLWPDGVPGCVPHPGLQPAGGGSVPWGYRSTSGAAAYDL